MMEPFITTFTGRKVNPLNLKETDISLDDIAHHLACINRFVGALKTPVNVAQHSVYVSRLLDGTGYELLGLLHDASEAYLGDVSKWVKQHAIMEVYRRYEDDAQNTILRALHCTSYNPPELKVADRLMVRFEAWRGFDGHECHMFTLPSHPEPTKAERDRVGKWAPWSWKASEEAFLARYRMLTLDQSLSEVMV